MKIQKGDKVKVLYGKDAGKISEVLFVDKKHDKVLIKDVNVFKRSLKGDGKTRKSSIVELVKPVPVSKVMYVCNSCQKPSRIGTRLEKDNYVRFCKNCDKIITYVKINKKLESKKMTKVSDKKNVK